MENALINDLQKCKCETADIEKRLQALEDRMDHLEHEIALIPPAGRGSVWQGFKRRLSE